MLDADLQTVVNELWHDGAEAIAINGKRLTATSTIRAAGSAILVDFQPLNQPYKISAIGPPHLDDRLRDSPTGQLYQRFTQTYGMHFTITAADNLSLPAAADPQLRYATTVNTTGARLAVPLVLRRSLMFAVLAMIVGVVLGVVLEPTVPVALQPYLPIAVVAALDAVFGGIRARLDGIFDDKQFVISFVSNVLVAALIVYLGDQLGVGGQLSTGVVVVLGVRIFGNVAAIRRHLFRA